jgi:hypothetical protein
LSSCQCTACLGPKPWSCHQLYCFLRRAERADQSFNATAGGQCTAMHHYRPFARP